MGNIMVGSLRLGLKNEFKMQKNTVVGGKEVSLLTFYSQSLSCVFNLRKHQPEVATRLKSLTKLLLARCNSKSAKSSAF